jgi:PAS domain S-box-containing protein
MQEAAHKMFDSLTARFNRWRRNRRRLSGVTNQPHHFSAGQAGEFKQVCSDVSTSQQELQRRWEYLAEAQKLSHSGIFAWNVSDGMLEWSDETYRILGFTRETHPTLDLVFDRIHPEDRQRLVELRDRAARDGMDLDVEHRLLMPNGDIRYLHVVAHAGHHSSSNREYIGIVSDITERKRAEEERQALSSNLQESKAWLEEAQRVAHLGYWVWDLETNQVIWSEETDRIFGLSPQAGSFDVAKVGEMIHPDDREAVFRTAEEAIRSGTRAECEHRLIRPDGEIRIVHSLGDLKKDPLGRPYQMFGTTQDITERKRAEQALQRSQFYLSEGERLAHMGSWASSDLGIRWSDDLNIYWSDEVYKIFGFDPKNGTPQLQQFLAAIHPQDRASFTEAMKKMHEYHCDCDVTNRIVRPDGEIRYVRCVGVPVVEDGVFQGFHGTTMDVTQHELMTQELRREQAYLAEAQRLTHTGSWASNLVTRQVSHSSQENNRLYGFDVSQYPNPFDLHYSSILAEDELALRSKLENAIRTGADFDVEYRIRRADGAIRFLRGIGHHNPAHEFGEYFGITMDITDQKRVEEEREVLSNALQQSNARLEEAQREARIGHYEFNPMENQVTWSAELCRIWGLLPVSGPIDLAVVFEMVHPEDRESAARAVEEILRSGTHLKYEHRIVRPDGEVRFLQVLGTVKRDASGCAYELFGTCQDITDRKLAEQALQRSEFYLNEGQRLAHMGSWALSAAGFDYWSFELFEVHGLDPRGKPPTIKEYLNLVHPEDRKFIEKMIQTIMVDHSEFDFTKRIVRPDGRMRYVRFVGVPVTSGGLFEGFVGTGIDVTEQELLTQELRREQAYLTDAQSMAHIGSWAYNLVTRKVLHSSDENARLYGFDPSEGPISAERFFATQHAEDAPGVNAVLERAVHEGTDFYLDEYRIHHTDGSIRFLRAIGHRNASGEPGDYVGVTMDITERKRAEEERERLRQLEADLAHTNRVNMMGELAAALAHEIKQPIAASVTSANALLRWLAHDPPDLKRARAAADRIEQDANRAAEVINSLQSFYKRGAPQKRAIVDLRGVIEEMAALLETEAARYSIAISAEIEEGTPKPRADRVQLQQVIMNLMLNAIEAMKDTGGELTIKSRLNPEGGLLVTISDTGVGLPEEWKDKIFDPFHSTKPQGTGMGLTITRSIVESYGGRVWATNNRGAGATFHLTLPSDVEAGA